ncbi:MAG: hypothetical protein HYT97_09915 [Elusimicrobia bacterium]|nr:hypothetical protein [Elusimicrobiota bacterium]
MKLLPKFKTKQEEANFWMQHDTVDFWNSFENIREPIEIAPNLREDVKKRHEKTKAISIRLYPSQLRMAKAIAYKQHIPYQTILRDMIEQGLSQVVAKHHSL